MLTGVKVRLNARAEQDWVCGMSTSEYVAGASIAAAGQGNPVAGTGGAHAGVRPLSVDITNCNTTGKVGQHSCNHCKLGG